MINDRKTTLFEILQRITEKQKNYFISGDSTQLLPYPQKEIAHDINIYPSTVSRAISNRSIDTKWGEKPLKYFFPLNKKLQIKDFILEIIEKENNFSDIYISNVLKEKYKIAIARRTVAKYRNELNIPNKFNRKKKESQNEQK